MSSHSSSISLHSGRRSSSSELASGLFRRASKVYVPVTERRFKNAYKNLKKSGKKTFLLLNSFVYLVVYKYIYRVIEYEFFDLFARLHTLRRESVSKNLLKSIVLL